MSQTTIADNPVLRNYVSPHLCIELVAAGYHCDHKFFWDVYEDDTILGSHIFDIDEYYKEGNEMVDNVTEMVNKIMPRKERLPAFTIKDLEHRLPDYCVCRLNNKYEICVDKHYGIESAFADRLPDAYARIMLACLKKRVMKIN